MFNFAALFHKTPFLCPSVKRRPRLTTTSLEPLEIRLCLDATFATAIGGSVTVNLNDLFADSYLSAAQGVTVGNTLTEVGSTVTLANAAVQHNDPNETPTNFADDNLTFTPSGGVGQFNFKVDLLPSGQPAAETVHVTVTAPESSAVTPTVSLNVPDAVYTGLAYDQGNLSATIGGSAQGTITYKFYRGTTEIAAPIDAGSYSVQAFFTSSDYNLWNDSQSPATAFIIAKANATIAIAGYSGTYDGNAHGLTGSATGVDAGGAALGSSLSLGASFTNAPGGTAHWVFTGGTNYNDQVGDVNIAIAKADAVVTVSGYSGIYDAAAHGATGSASGVQGEDLSSLLNLGDTYTNAGAYSAAWSFAGNDNYNIAAGTESVVIRAVSLDQFVSGTTQSALNLAKDGTISFAIRVSGGIVDGNTVSQLFNGAQYTLQMKNASGGYESCTVTAIATVIDNVVYVNLKMSQDAYTFLRQGLEAAETSASKANWEIITLSATSNGGNYTMSEDALTRIFQAGKVTYS